MSNTTFYVDYVHGSVYLPDAMEHIFTVSNHNAPLSLFSDDSLTALTIYLAWKSSIAAYYPSISIYETASFRLWAMGPCSLPGETGPPLPRVAVAALACFPEARALVEQGGGKSHYELFRWLWDNLSIILPGYSLPDWLYRETNMPGVSLGQEYFWLSLDDVLQNSMPIYKDFNHKLCYLGWLRKNFPRIFRLCTSPQTIEATLDAPSPCDTGEGLTVLMEAVYTCTPMLHQAMSLDTQEGRIAYSSWFLRHQVPAYGVLNWTWDCLLRPCQLSSLSTQEMPKVIVGAFLGECPSFQRWEELTENRQGDFIAICMSELVPLLKEKNIPEYFAALLSMPANENPHAAACGVGLLQQRLWEKETDNRLNSCEDCQDCIAWFIRTYGNTPLFSLSSHRQITRWGQLGLLSKRELPQSALSFLEQRETDSISILGWQDGLLGIGVDSRMAAKALEQAGVRVHRVAVSHLLPYGGAAYPLAQEPEREPRSLCSVVCLAAQDIYRLWLAAPQNWWTGRYTIGLCPWELPRWPKSAFFAVEMLDEIWAPSKFIAEAFAACGKPVVHMPHAVIPPEPDGDLRRELGIAPDTIVFFSAYDSNASCVRKNPLAVIAAFNKAFAGTQHDVKLIVKTMNATNHPAAWQELQDKNRCGDKVLFIDESLPMRQHARLLNTCDAFVSLHRSEGFGRLLAEAMSIPKLLICSNFSGNTDFSTHETACLVEGKAVPVPRGAYLLSQGQEWFEADSDHAAMYMREFAASPDAYQPQRLAGRQFILEHHSCEAIGARAVAALKKAGILNGG